jgi:hypothetical protein
MNQKQKGPTHQKNQAPKKKGRNANCTRSEMPKNMVSWCFEGRYWEEPSGGHKETTIV